MCEKNIKLEIGCGDIDQKEGYVGLDIFDYGQEIVRNIEKGIPLCDNSVTAIYCQHVLEHIHDLLFVMNEIWRVCKKDATVEILVPHKNSINAVRDPTHIRFFDEYSMDYYVPNFIHKGHGYGLCAAFEIVKKEVRRGEEVYWMLRAIK